MSIFNHDLIPQILRTKLMPELEEKEISLIRQTREFEQINKNGEVIFCLYNNFNNCLGFLLKLK